MCSIKNSKYAQYYVILSIKKSTLQLLDVCSENETSNAQCGFRHEAISHYSFSEHGER